MTDKPIVIASDHAGIHLKQTLVTTLQMMGVAVEDYGTHDEKSVDYPDYAARACQAIEDGIAERAILICGSGIGMSIAANRYKSIRAALCHNAEAAILARQHNNANVLVLGARMTDDHTALVCMEAFLDTEFDGGRHQHRIDKLNK